jgi:hypothetical protein
MVEYHIPMGSLIQYPYIPISKIVIFVSKYHGWSFDPHFLIELVTNWWAAARESCVMAWPVAEHPASILFGFWMQKKPGIFKSHVFLISLGID